MTTPHEQLLEIAKKYGFAPVDGKPTLNEWIDGTLDMSKNVIFPALARICIGLIASNNQVKQVAVAKDAILISGATKLADEVKVGLDISTESRSGAFTITVFRDASALGVVTPEQAKALKAEADLKQEPLLVMPGGKA